MPDKVSPISYVERFAKEQAEKQNKEQNALETSKEAKKNGNKHKKAENGKTES